MTISRRSVLTAAGLGLAGIPLAHASRGNEATVTELVRRSEESNAALMRGDAQRYRAMIIPADDFVLMSPFGGPPSRGSAFSPESVEKMGRFFRNGTFAMELVQAWATDDMITLATIERTNVEVGGLPAQDWALRVTLVYRRDGSEWRLVHRHADPFVETVSLEQAAAIARGERAPKAADGKR